MVPYHKLLGDARGSEGLGALEREHRAIALQLGPFHQPLAPLQFPASRQPYPALPCLDLPGKSRGFVRSGGFVGKVRT